MKTLVSFLLCFTGFMAIAPEAPKKKLSHDDYMPIAVTEKQKADKVVSENYALISELELRLAEEEFKKYFKTHDYKTLQEQVQQNR